MLLHQVAVVSESNRIDFAELATVSAALQKQATRDFGPIWEVSSTVDAFGKLEDVPLGYWPIIIQDDIGFAGAAGIHLDKDGQPFALVNAGDQWSLTASHECLEMLGDPWGNRLSAGRSLKKGQGRVEYLVEVCDPSEAEPFAYTVNGVLMSDFYTPNYFDPMKNTGVRYSFTGAIKKPREVLEGGYISWHWPVTDEWWQLTFFGAKKFRNLGVLGQLTGGVRAMIDKLTPSPLMRSNVHKGSKALLTAAAASDENVVRSTNSKAQAWRAQIQALKEQS